MIVTLNNYRSNENLYITYKGSKYIHVGGKQTVGRAISPTIVKSINNGTGNLPVLQSTMKK